MTDNAPLDEKAVDHPRIWLEPAGAPDRCWCSDNQWGDEGVEYVLAASPSPSEMEVGKLLWRAEETRADLLTHHRKEAGVVGELADALQAMQARAEKAERERDYWQKQHDERTFFLGQCATEKETAEARMKDATGLLDHLIGWIVHDCGAEPPFTSEQDETYAALKGDHAHD